MLRRHHRMLSSNDLLRSHEPYLTKCSFCVKGLAMCCREQLKSETCFLKNVVCFKYGRTVLAKAINLQYQMKTAESFRNRRRKKGKIEKEKQKGPREKSATTSAKQNVTGQRRRGPRFGCFEVNQKSFRIQ